MLYKTATFWTEGGVTWHSLSADNGRDMSMGPLKSWEVERSIAWAKSHNMTINDNR